MNLSTLLLPHIVGEFSAPPAFVDKTYGEPLFFTESEVMALQYSPDGRLWSIEESGYLREWGPDGRLLNRTFLNDGVQLWVLNADATLAASITNEIAVWDTAIGEVLASIETESPVASLAFSPDGELLASGHDDGIIRLWNARTLKLTGELVGHRKDVCSLAFRADTSHLASASEDHTIRIWDLTSKTCVEVLSGHTDRIPSLAWHPSGEYLVSAGWDTSARVWQPPATEPLMLLNSHSEQVHLARFSPDGALLVCADSDFTIHLWTNPKSGRVLHVLTGHADEIKCLCFSADGRQLASAGADHVVHVWDTQTGQLVAGPNPQARHGIALGESENGMLVFSNAGSALQAWDAESGELDWSPKTAERIGALAASPNGKYLVTSGAGHEAHLWDLDEQKVLATLSHTRGPIAAPVFSNDSTLIADASQSDGLVWIWKIGTPEAILVIPEAAETSVPEVIAFHPNGKWLGVGGFNQFGTAGHDGDVCIWDLEARDKQFTLEIGASALAFDPNGTLLACGRLNQTVEVRELSAPEKILFNLEGHHDRIGALAFSPDGSYLVSASDDGTLRVWNMLTGRLTVARQFEVALQSLAFSADGEYLYTGNGNFTAYRLEMQRLLED